MSISSQADSSFVPHGRVVTTAQLSDRVNQLIDRGFHSHRAVALIRTVTNGEAYLFGGALRRAMLGDKLSGDLDMMIPNGDDRATSSLDALGVPFVLNSQGLRKYRWGSLEIDLFQPREFFRGFPDVESAVSYFDLRINALAMHLGSGRIIDPFNILATPVSDPGINWPQWAETSPAHAVHLAIRLAKVMYETPDLTISSQDGAKLRREILPLILASDWLQLRQRFPEGKEAFIACFEATVLDRVRLSAI